MSTFSEYLSDYIGAKDLSWKKAAMLCNIDRSLLRRYAKGEILPKDEERVLAIADGFQMTKQEKEELCERYQCEKIGELPYRGQILLERIFNGKYKKRIRHYEPAGAYEEQLQGWDQEQIKRLEGEEALLHCIGFLAADAEWACFQIPLASANEKIVSILAGAPEDCKLVQMIEINNAGDGREELAALEKLLPLLLAGKAYTVFCRYKWKQEIHKDDLQMGMLVTNRGLLLFDGTLAHGVYTGQEGYKEYYREIFETECNQCTVFAQSLKGDSPILKRQQERCRIENTVSGMTFTYTADVQGEVIRIKRMGKTARSCYITEIRLVELFKEYMDIVSKGQA